MCLFMRSELWVWSSWAVDWACLNKSAKLKKRIFYKSLFFCILMTNKQQVNYFHTTPLTSNHMRCYRPHIFWIWGEWLKELDKRKMIKLASIPLRNRAHVIFTHQSPYWHVCFIWMINNLAFNCVFHLQYVIELEIRPAVFLRAIPDCVNFTPRICRISRTSERRSWQNMEIITHGCMADLTCSRGAARPLAVNGGCSPWNPEDKGWPQ